MPDAKQVEKLRQVRLQLEEAERLAGIGKGGKGRGGGWNKKTVEEHVRDGTYRADRHGAAPAVLVTSSKKPPGKVTASAKSQRRFVRSAADEHALRSGCRYNERLADYVVSFFENSLCHTKGQWQGEPFLLTPWQQENIIRPIFGWVREDGTRRFRRSYIEIPKKNYKSTIAAGIGLYMLTGDEEPGAEIWSLGGDKNQARVVHDDAVAMAEASPKLAGLKINHATLNISYPATNSYYRAVAASPRGKHGPSLHCAIADELHEWYGDELWKSIRYSFRARRQPLLFVITNAGNNLQSLCYKQREKAKAILEGAAVDDDFFAMILSVSREEAEAEIAAVKEGAVELPVAARCNPGLGHVIQVRDLVQDIRDAIQSPSELPNLLRLTYGVWDTAVSPWLQTGDWEACGADFSAEDLAGQECHEALDLSLTGDMSSVVLMFPIQDEETGRTHYRQLAHFWIPEKTAEERKHLIDYRAWEKAGCLTIVPGAVISYSDIREALAEYHERFAVKSFSFDPMYASVTAQWVQENYPEIEVIKFAQTIIQFAGPTAEYERLILGRGLLHNKNPLLTWQASHCKVWTDSNRNKRPTKPKANDIRAVDGIVAGVMALARAWQPPEAPSAYEDDETQFNSVEEIMSQTDDEELDELDAAGDDAGGPGATAESDGEDLEEENPKSQIRNPKQSGNSKKGKSKTDKPQEAPPPAAVVKTPTAADVAIAAVLAGETVECSEGQYRRQVRKALEDEAVRLSGSNKTELCRQVLDEIRRLDAEFHYE